LIEKIRRSMPEPTSSGQLRSFGLILAGVFFLLALWPLVFDGNVRLWGLLLSGLFGLPALLAPLALRYPFRVWMLIGHCLGWLNSRIIMTLLFFLVFTPVAIVFRIIKRDVLERRLEPGLTTYRVAKERRTASHLKHQF
jgi:hypothetical protein